jgi:hypothetical protein
MRVNLGEIQFRGQFGHLLRSKKLTGWAVEVGTHRGDFAFILLSDWPGKLYCVDPWAVPLGYEAQAVILQEALHGAKKREEDMDFCRRKLSGYGERVELVQRLSVEAADGFVNESLDFVYLDGDHRPKEVAADIAAWWPKLKKGGILAGHDFVTVGQGEEGWGYGVQKALINYLPEAHEVFMVIEENGLPWSFYTYKS